MTRGSRASQIATVSLPASPGAGATSRVCDVDEAASVRKPAISSPEKPSRRCANCSRKKFLLVGGEIDDQQASARPQRARRLAQRARGIVEEVQHLMDDDEVVGVALDRRRVNVALAQQHVAQARLRRCARARW